MGKTKYTFLLIIVFLGSFLIAAAQPGTTIELTKPEKYENRTLNSEKTGEKKFGFSKKLYNNTVSHYNYYFNANTRLNEIVERAKSSSVDDYTKLLPFYNYSLDVTANDGDIDSIIYKCNAGILLHDLRSDWVDDLYFLMGKAYFYRKNFDTAAMVFQYINYAFAKKDEGYDIPIGSNADNTGVFSIATKEDAGLIKKITSKPPRRNEDLLWQAINYMEAERPYDAAGILEILRKDPNFPKRLQSDLDETYAYWYYKQKLYDSAATLLSRTLDNADNKADLARREFLAGQLFMLGGNNEKSSKYFARSADHATDPIMEVYANLNGISAGGDTTDLIQQKINALYKLAHKEKFVNYRDIIYYTAAIAETDRKNYNAAAKLLQQSIKFNLNNPVQRSLSFAMLGDVDYNNGNYERAFHDYDSVDLSSITDELANARIQERLPALRSIADNVITVHLQDSLQTVAKMPLASRDILIKKTLRQLQKEQGVKDDENTPFVNPAVQQSALAGPMSSPDDVVTLPNLGGKGDWYFNNQSLKSNGVNSFKATWGNRPNVDNWRRMQAVATAILEDAGNTEEDDSISNNTDSLNLAKGGMDDIAEPVDSEEIADNTGELSFEILEKRLPLTDEKMASSNKKIIKAIFENAQIFQNQLEDYPAAIKMYDSLNKRFPDNIYHEESLFNLFYCYSKIGKKYSADSSRAILDAKFKDGKFADLLNNPLPQQAEEKDDPATKQYEAIYDMFVEGNFEKAKTEKAKADSVYGNSYWTPQLLYIESIYYVSKKEDSTAIVKLTSLAQSNNTALAEKATTMIDVLSRRKEIEDYLTALQVTRLSEDEVSPIVNLNPVETIVEKKEYKQDSIVSKPVIKQMAASVDTSKATGVISKVYTFNPAEAQFAAILLDKVDPVYANETRNAFTRYNQTAYYNQKLAVTSVKISDENILVIIGPFTDAATGLAYIDKTKPLAPTRILPWLTASKYSFTLISQSNLDVMKDTKDIEGYKKLLHQALPDKF